METFLSIILGSILIPVLLPKVFEIQQAQTRFFTLFVELSQNIVRLQRFSMVSVVQPCDFSDVLL